ncbi:MAG: extracellular solute-binding protein [Verrucomicrobiota bacterium]
MLVRISIVIALLLIVLTAPFIMRAKVDTGVTRSAKAERLVIITPHNESIQAEFGRAFSDFMEDAHNREVYIDWRQPGGTSEIAKFMGSEYSTRFENLWRQRTRLPFRLAIRDAYTDSGLDEAAAKAIQLGLLDDLTLLDRDNPEQLATVARALYLESDIGIGIDLFFGGGAYDFSRQASYGHLVAHDNSGKYGPGPLAESQPDWFSDRIMPATVSGEPFRDDEFRWVGTVLSAFGICYNKDSLARLDIEEGLQRWDDLADPRLIGQVALADPTKSGSTTKAFEMLIQERIQRIIRNEGLAEEEAIRRGWREAMQLILKISANSRYFTDSAAKVPRDVALGDAAAGMSIDFYGRTFNELFKNEQDESHVEFVMPRAGTSIGADPIGMLRGAPSPDLAHHFIKFILSPDGQQIWNFRPGSPGGPKRFALRRPPIRKDFYTTRNQHYMTDPEVNPYEIAEGFTYHPEWTGALFASLRFIIRTSCIEPHHEQQKAWESLIERGMPLEDLARFEDVSVISYDEVMERIAPVLKGRDKVAEIKMAREYSQMFRRQYEEVIQSKAKGGST